MALTMLSCSAAQATDRRELVEIIAGCVGRISAELEFAWLLSDPVAQNYETQRAQLVDILEAVGYGGDKRRQLSLRIEAKVAHSNLLTTAYFHKDGTHSAWAKRHASMQRASCQNMLLDG